VELLRDGMRVDLGGIAMGYAVDEAMKVIRRHGITRYLVDGSGDIGAGDPPPGSPGWVVGVPGLEADSPPMILVRLANRSLTTSGDAMQFVEIGGQRYSHIVDPRTGIALTDHSCVTVVAADTITADALASAVSVLGPEKGLKLIEDTPGAAAFILRAPGGEVERYESRRWAAVPKVNAARPVDDPTTTTDRGTR
jgi:thiamine biosynthesis lipoprotein